MRVPWWGRLPADDVPDTAVPRLKGSGNGGYVSLLAGGALILPALLLIAAGLFWPTSLHRAVGIGETVDATVESETYQPRALGGRRGGGCDRVRFVLTWDRGEGTVSPCTHHDLAKQTQVGDEVEIYVLPWTSRVEPTSDMSPFEDGALLAGILAVGGWGVLIIVRGRRIRRGTAVGPAYDGVVVVAAPRAAKIVVRLDDSDLGQVRLLAAGIVPFVAGDRVTVHASRRVRGRAAGPWVVRGRAFAALCIATWRLQQRETGGR